MRTGVLQRITSRLLWFTVAALLVPMLVGLWYRDGVWWAFALPAVLAAMFAYAFARLPAARNADTGSLRRREGFVAVTLGWLVLVWFSALAFYLTGAFTGFAEAFFESMSGYTTTGASVVSEIEALPESVLFMRSFSHWIGGMGIIVLSVAILPELAVGGMQLFATESTGLEADKLAPRIAATARRLWVIYAALTAVQTLLLLLGGMSLFDAVNHAMATIATGGFSTKNNSVAGFDSVYIEMVILVFMFISGMSFALQYRAVLDLRSGRAPRHLLRSPEVKLYTAITLASIAIISAVLMLAETYDSVGACLRYGSFQVVSIVTTTGFGTADFNTWPRVTQFLLVALMLIGGCAGSTAGGSKVIRLFVVIQHARVQLRKLVRPRLVQTMQIGNRPVPHETTEAVLGFYLLYFAAFFIGSLGMTALGLDLVSGTTAAISALNSIGPGLASVGPAANFAGVPDVGLYLLSFGMLLGRLEIYPLLVLFTAHFWRRG
ncbi:TrkH family potassium uptake protein [Haliangium sp.]|uniref:TrkH family potassium uptake protein n=1 Tax=Haliangium sp. TaxID=2663208 RepID=UPI003D13F474